MTRLAVIALLVLAACEFPSVPAYDMDGKRLKPAYLVMAPLCLLICPITVQTTGSDIKTVGSGSGSNTQTSTATTGINK